MQKLFKYPRTPHIEGSKKRVGDEDLDIIPFDVIKGRNLVIEEKIDGANSAISFTTDGELLLQSRGHYLTGGYRERHFNLFKAWSMAYKDKLWEILNDKYIMYGEWMYAKHTIFYNSLPHYFMEFDVYDKEKGIYLSTNQRRRMFKQYKNISSVFVLYEGKLDSSNQLQGFINKSQFISDNHIDDLQSYCRELKLDDQKVFKETDNSNFMEGLYIKVENDDCVEGRYKYIRRSFLTNVQDSDSHWIDRPIIPNLLKSGVDIFNQEI